MILIVGLDNPGGQFKNTRHNVGFMAIDEFAEKNNFPEFKLSKKYNALISENENMLLAKPQTFMNDSGKAVKKITESYKGPRGTPAKSLIVIHDDVDLPVGSIKIVKDRGSAGHKGVESIIKNIGNDGLIRIRIGIKPQKNIEAKKIVLKKFSKEEKEIINKVLQRTTQAINVLITDGLEKAMNEYNR